MWHWNIDAATGLRLAGLALLLAALPLAWWAWRSQGQGARGRLTALVALTMFLTFDLIVFGAFTRLTDSGLGCPDWPGCYGEVSPLGAKADIHAAQSALPDGPVTHAKAWIEMIHRYLAMTVGVLIIAIVVQAWRHRRALGVSMAWPLFTLAWVIMQGLFGKYTVTLKLYPAIVTLHLLGGLGLLALLVAQFTRWRAPSPATGVSAAAVGAVFALVAVQAALGGWVSTNYAVLACQGFPTCNGQWWPAAMDFEHGFTVLRELGRAGHGGFLPAEALVAIHWVHRLFAAVVAVAALALAAAGWRQAGSARLARAVAALVAWQILSGMSNVVLGWPIVAALAHSAGAAALVGVLTAWWARAVAPSPRTAPHSARLAGAAQN